MACNYRADVMKVSKGVGLDDVTMTTYTLHSLTEFKWQGKKSLKFRLKYTNVALNDALNDDTLQ